MLGTGILFEGETNVWLYIYEFLIFLKSGLPPVIHPAISSGIGIASNFPLGNEISLFNDERMKFLFEQNMK